ncbi:hypothetical protein AWN76_015370 [Rhodothermaceae bacterium RA]|nr:hypothetical protein AWN76_015370 [Rhodothermaceae bacterium RA]
MTARPPRMTTAYELVRCSLQVAWNPAAREQLPERAAGVDWEEVVRVAETEGVWTEVSRTLLATEGVVVPKALVRPWTLQHARLKLRRAEQAAAAAALVDHLAARGIPSLVLKGIVLEQQVYGETGWRATSDIDLLVDEARFAETEQALFEAGYGYPGDRRRPDGAVAGANPRRHIKEAVLYLFGERAYVSDETTEVTIDLHVLPLDRRFTFRRAFEALYADRRHVTVEQHALPTLSLPDTMIYTAYRGLDSAWRLKYTRDMAGLIHRHEVDWPALAAHARRCGAQRVLAYMLGEVQQRLGLPLPPAARALVDPDWWQAMAVRYGQDRRAQEPGWYRLRRYLAFMDDTRARMRFLWFVGLHRGVYEPVVALRRLLQPVRPSPVLDRPGVDRPG